MTSSARPRLLVPAALVVVSVAGCPASDDSDTTSTDGSDSADSSGSATSAPTTTGPTTTGPTTTTDVTTESTGSTSEDASTSTADSGTDTGDLPTCTDLADEPMCQTESQCIWLPELGGCIRNCEMITDLAVCMDSPGCVVYGDMCGYEPIA